VGISLSTLGEDDALMENLKKGIQNNDLTIANHGLDNDILINLDKQKQSDIIKESTNNIFEEFNVTPKLFVPALYQFNDDTKKALLENGYTHMSAGLETDTPPYPLQGESLYRFPSLAFTAEYSQSKERIVGIPSEETFSDVLNGIDTFGYAVISITPQEFSIYRNGGYQNVINRDQFSELKTLMDKIKTENIKVVEIEEINKNVSFLDVPETLDNSLGPKFIPGWIKNTAGWWRDGYVDDNSFVQSIQFLIQEKIIQTSQTTKGSGNSEIPNWIKDTAGWWAEGLIPDDDFIFGVEYMIDNGIIAIQA